MRKNLKEIGEYLFEALIGVLPLVASMIFCRGSFQSDYYYLLLMALGMSSFIFGEIFTNFLFHQSDKEAGDATTVKIVIISLMLSILTSILMALLVSYNFFIVGVCNLAYFIVSGVIVSSREAVKLEDKKNKELIKEVKLAYER